MLAQSGSSEAELLAGAAAGKPSAVRALLDGFGPAVYGFVYARVGGHAEVAEDLVQETFIEAVRSASTFRGESSLRTWLCAIAKHRLSRHYEAERRRALVRSGLAVVPEPPPDRSAEIERRDQVTRALGGLPPLHRQVLVLKYLDERSVEEIAAELGRSRVQVQSLLQRARAGLRQELEGDHAADEPDLRGIDGERPLPPALCTRLEAALLDEAANVRTGGTGGDETVVLLEGVALPRPLPQTTRKALERALIRRPGRERWQLPVAAAAALLLLVASVATLSGDRAGPGTVASGPSSSTPSVTEPVPKAATPAEPQAAAPAEGTVRPARPTTATTGCPGGCPAPIGAAGGGSVGAGAASPSGDPSGPVVDSVEPASGPMSGGTTVTVKGAGFTRANGVLFGSSAAVSFTVVSDSEIRAVSPPASQPGTVVVSATFPDGSASRAGPGGHFSYTAPVP